MSTLLRLCLLLAAFSTLVSAGCHHSPTTFYDCSGDEPVSLPDSEASTPFFKPQVRVNPADIYKNGTGWEEWLFLAHNRLPDDSVFTYSYKWALGDPASANVSHTTFIAIAYLPNGTFYRQISRGEFMYEEHEDGGFTYSIADNHLTWDPDRKLWITSVNANGWIIESTTE
jgi:hypothetical protein